VKRRTEIIIETERLLIVGGRKKRTINWCAPCGKHVEALTTDEAALLARVTSRTIFSWVEAGRVHYMETPEGLLLICPNSLP
jgi:hypothetical protein